MYTTTIELKTEIQQTLEKMPDEVLLDILDYLLLVQTQTHDQAKQNNNIKKFLFEDRELFKRLAK